MRILQLSDLHFNSKNKSSDHVAMIESLIKNQRDEPFDLVLFSGDLVFNGKESSYREANEVLFESLNLNLKIKRENIFICCGNHDLTRGEELRAIQDAIDSIKSEAELSKFIVEQDGKQFKASLANFNNYNAFQKTLYEDHIKLDDELNDLYSVHVRLIDGKKVGILSINSSWRSRDSKIDRGNLIYPTQFLKDAVNKLKGVTDFRILMMHHPVEDLKYWNKVNFEDIVYNDFHMLISGHVHLRKSSTHITYDEGIFCCTSPATMDYNSDTHLGFSVLDVNLDDYEVSVQTKLYDKRDRIFLSPDNPIEATIPLDAEKRSQISLRKAIRNRLEEEKDIANELFLNSKNDQRGFLDLFTEPTIKRKSVAEIAKSHEDVKSIQLDTISNSTDSYLIYGRDKSGKTALLYKALISLLESFSTTRIIPVYLNSNDYKSDQKKLDIEKILREKYHLNKSKLAELLERNHVKLLIDNYNVQQNEFNGQVNSFLNKNLGNSSFIVLTEPSLTNQFDSFDFGSIVYSKLYLHEIKRTQVRQLTNKWPNIQESKRELVIEKIDKIFNQLNIPMNYWTVSLFLWIFEKTSETNFHNNFELIQLYIDNLLDRESLVLDKSIKVDFDDVKNYLGYLAHFLITGHHKDKYSATYSELVDFTETYRKNNIRFVIEVEDLINIILTKGIIKKNSESRYTFRLNGVFEYFLAFHMKDNKIFRDDAIKDDHFYLSFSNEFELYSGFEKKDERFVKKIYEKTESIFSEVNKHYDSLGTKDEVLIGKIAEVFDLQLPSPDEEDGENLKLTPERQDEIVDSFSQPGIRESEVKQKIFLEKIEDNSDNLEKSLFLLSRVFRNSAIDNIDLNNSILDFILNSACNLGFRLIDESADGQNGHSEIEEEDQFDLAIMKLVTNYMPLVVQTFLFDALAQNNLERILLEKIKELETDYNGNQFKLLILYFLLIDLDLNQNKRYLDTVIEKTTHGILKSTTLLKLYTYVLFKSNNNPDLDKYLKERIRVTAKKIDNRADLGSLDSKITKQKRIANLRKKSES